jgi:hypothetical protein
MDDHDTQSGRFGSDHEAIGAGSRQERYPGYDVLSKRDTPSWNQQTRTVIDERLSIDPDHHAFFTDAEWQTLNALCDRLVPQPPGRPGRVPIAALVDQKVAADLRDGYRHAMLPPIQEAWRRALAALDAEAKALRGRAFHALEARDQDTLIRGMQDGTLEDPAWAGMPPKIFFLERAIADLIKAYYAHPTAWSEIGFGGPASPRGYVRLDFDRRDAWEAAEARPGMEAKARASNRQVGRR